MEDILQTALDALLAEREKLGDIDALLIARDRLDTQIAQLKGILNPAASKPAKVKGTRTLSPEARQRIADGQTKRWDAARARKAAFDQTAPVE